MLRATEGHWKQNHWTDHTRLTIRRLIGMDVEYYRDLEMWVRGHSTSLKLVLVESLGARFLFTFYSNYVSVAV